jgi:hypothetical protein
MAFSRVVQVCDSHSRTTPTTHPRNGMSSATSVATSSHGPSCPERSWELGAVLACARSRMAR